MPDKVSKNNQESRGTLRADLVGPNSRSTWEPVASRCVAKPELIPELLELCRDAELSVQKNAGAVLGKIIDLDEEILVPHLAKILKNLKGNPHDSVKRGTMRVLQKIEIPEAVEGSVFDIAMEYLSDFREPIAVKVFSITTARRLCQRYPSLSQEVLPIVRELIQQKVSTGILSRAKKELKLLEKLSASEKVGGA